MKLDSFYLAGTGVCLPTLRPLREIVAAGLYSPEEAAVTQLESVAIASDVYPPDMAVTAAREAVRASRHHAQAIGIALHAHLGDQGILGWHAASYVHRLAVGNSCPVIEVDQRSNGGMAAIGLAISYLKAWDSDVAALVTTADRFEDIPHGRFRFDDVLILGDAGTACVVSRESGFARVRSFFTHTDTTLEQVHRGAASPSDGIPSGEAVASYRERKSEYFSIHPPLRVVARFANGGKTAVDRALADAGVAQREIDRWVLPNIGRDELESYYLRPLGIPLEATCWLTFGRTVGHLGAGDQIAGVHHLHTTGALRPGELCALVGIGSGFSWSCSVLEAL